MIIKNKQRYLSLSLVNQCFKPNQYLSIDKQVCGNGFSTAFLKIEPSLGSVNILLAPNKAFLISKFKEYKTEKLKTTNRIKFFYKESKETNFDDADVLVFVADSFLYMGAKLQGLQVDKVLIDEYHTIEKDSSFRRNLVDFKNKVQSIITTPGVSISTVTASPNLYSHIDIKIKNKGVKPTAIIVSKNRVDGISRIRDLIKKNKEIVIFTNSATTIYKILQKKNIHRNKKQLGINWIVGDTMMRNLAELVEIKQDDTSNITIVTSKGFEGCDIYYKNANVFFFEDRANEHESFFIANLYQAINRTRLGAKYIEYNRQEVNKTKIPIDLKELKYFVNREDISTESKQKKKYKRLHKFVIFTRIDGVFQIKTNWVAINLYNERKEYDLPSEYLIDNPIEIIKNFCEDRKIIFKRIDKRENQERVYKRVGDAVKIKMLTRNIENIDAIDLYGKEYFLRVKSFESWDKPNRTISDCREDYYKYLKEFLRRKNYANLYEHTKSQNIALELLYRDLNLEPLISKVVKSYNDSSIQKYGIKKSKKYREEFRDQAIPFVCQWVLAFVNNRINLPKRWVANRDYNLATFRGISVVETIAKSFEISVTEIDVKNCFPRVLYAVNGLKLPRDFYGLNKVNKLGINIFLNSFKYDKTKSSTYSQQKYHALNKFQSLGFHTIVVGYMIKHFFNAKHKGDLFTFLSSHEKDLITYTMQSFNDSENKGVVRRHDSVLIFDNKQDLSHLNSTQYLGLDGWYDLKIQEKSENLQSDDDFWSEISVFNLNKKIQKSEGIELDFLQYKLGVLNEHFGT